MVGNKKKNDVFQPYYDLLELVDRYKINNIYTPWFFERAVFHFARLL